MTIRRIVSTLWLAARSNPMIAMARITRSRTMRSRQLTRDLITGFRGLSVGSFVHACPCSVDCDASGQAVGIHIICTKRNEHVVVFGIGGDRMGGARRVSEGPRGYRRHVEGRYQLLKGLVARADDTEDRRTLSGQGCGADDLGRTQRAGRGGRVV